MSTITYQFRTLGAENARRELLAQAAAARELAKAKRESDRVSAPAARRAGGGSDPEVKAEQARTKALAVEARKRVREEAKAAADIERSQRKATRATEAETQRQARARERAEKQQLVMTQRQAKQQEKLQYRQRQQATRQYERELRQRDTMKRQARADSFESLNNAAVGLGTGAAAVGVAATRTYMANQQRSRDLAVNAGSPDQAASLLSDAEKTARSVTGTKTEDVLAAQQKIVSMTGNLDLARGNSRNIAIAARATGSSEEDIASVVASMNQKFGMSDPEEIKAALANAIQQGKSGAFELKDASTYMAEMGAAGSRFGLDRGGTGFAKLGAMAQVARASTGSGAEASTGVQAMLRQLVSKSDDIKRMNGGKEVVFADKGKTKTNDIVDVVARTIAATKGDQGKLQKVFGDEGMKGASGFITAFNDAANALGKNATEAQRLAAGQAAVRAMFATAVNAGGQWSTVVEDAAARTDSSSARMTTAWETIVSSVGQAVTPALDSLSENADGVASILGMLADNVGQTLSDFASLSEVIRKIPGFEGKKTDRLERLGAIADDKHALEQSEAAGTITNRGASRLKKLRAEEASLVAEVAADNGLKSDTGGAYTAPVGPIGGVAPTLEGTFGRYGYGSADGSSILAREQERVAPKETSKWAGAVDTRELLRGLMPSKDDGGATEGAAASLEAAAASLKESAAAQRDAVRTGGNPFGGFDK